MTPAEAALQIANTVRMEFGYKPADRLKRGVPCEGTDCPIAMTIHGDGEFEHEVFVDTTYIRVGAEVWTFDDPEYGPRYFPLPQDAELFVTRFDAGAYAEYLD